MSAVAAVPVEATRQVKWCGRKGDLSLYLVHVDEGDGDKPALYIRNENRSPCTAVVVRFIDFWRFRSPADDPDLTREDITDGAMRIMRYCEVLYGLRFKDGCTRIRDCILEFASDVKNQTPPPGMTHKEWLDYVERSGVSLRVDGKLVLGG